MNNEPTLAAEIGARLRLNIGMAGIPVGEDDLEDLEARGYLQIVERFEQAMESMARDIPPDTGAWTVVAEGPVADSFAAEVAGSGSASLPVNLPPGHADAEPLAFATLRTVAALLRDRQVSAVELTTLSLNRISRIDPTLNAFQLVLADEALAGRARTADQVDDRLRPLPRGLARCSRGGEGSVRHARYCHLGRFQSGDSVIRNLRFHGSCAVARSRGRDCG